MDYAPLREMLKAGKWKEADQETWRVMCAVMGREEEGWLREEDAQKFPCTDLRTIDRLWVKYSDGRFGFSVQKQIYVETGNSLDGKYHEGTYEQFCEAVGWSVKDDWIDYSDVAFDTSAPKGHLPFLIGFAGWFHTKK